MWREKRAKGRINESKTDDASFITVSTFPTQMILKGFYSAVTPYSYLGNTDTRMRTTYTNRQIHKCTNMSFSLHTFSNARLQTY